MGQGEGEREKEREREKVKERKKVSPEKQLITAEVFYLRQH